MCENNFYGMVDIGFPKSEPINTDFIERFFMETLGVTLRPKIIEETMLNDNGVIIINIPNIARMDYIEEDGVNIDLFFETKLGTGFIISENRRLELAYKVGRREEYIYRELESFLRNAGFYKNKEEIESQKQLRKENSVLIQYLQDETDRF